MKANSKALAAFLGVFCAAAPLLGHHSLSSAYFMNQRASIEGDLVAFALRSPHSFVELDVKDPRTGELVRWSVEWGSAIRLQRQGLTRESLKPGDHVIIHGQPGRNAGEHRLHMLGIQRPADGWKWGRDSD
jgi:hypothetical protein